MDMTNTLLQLDHRPTELGRIRLGTKTDRGLPQRIDKWRLTSASRGYLEAAAAIYGGTVEEWTDAPDEGYFELFTETRELRVLIPRDLRTVSQAYELWQGGTCERRCDGQYEQITDGPCLCDPANRDCELMTRVSIMLPDVPGLGVWRLDTSGWHAATSLPATIEMLKSLSSQPWIPAVLRLEQRSKKTRDGAGKVVTHRFAVPVLDLPGITVGKVVAGMRNAPAPQIPATAQPAPTTAADRLAQQRAAIEARTTQGPVVGPEWQEVEEAPDEPPPPVDHAGVPAAIPTPSTAGSADPDIPMPAPPPGSEAPPLASEPGAQPCGAMPPEDDPLGLTAGGPCQLRGSHRVHRNAEGTWPKAGRK